MFEGRRRKMPPLDKFEIKIVKEYLDCTYRTLLPQEKVIAKVAKELNKSPELIKVYLHDISLRLMEACLKKVLGEPIIVWCARCQGTGKEQLGEGLQKGTCYDCGGSGEVEIEL